MKCQHGVSIWAKFDGRTYKQCPVITKHSSASNKGMTKILPIIDVLGYDGQNLHFLLLLLLLLLIQIQPKRKPYINMKYFGYVGFCNAMRLLIHDYKQPPLVAMTTVHIGQWPQAILAHNYVILVHKKVKYVCKPH